MNKITVSPDALKSTQFHFCPGCGHGVVHRLLAEAIDELGIREKTLGVPPVGCAALAADYLDVDLAEAPLGQALSVATGLKQVLNDRIIFTYQENQDLAAGAAQALQAAQRGDSLTVIFVNNSLAGTPLGNDARPLDLSRVLAGLNGCVYVERVSVADPELIARAGQAMKAALQTQMDGLGFSMVEVLSPCPTKWHMEPEQAHEWARRELAKAWPLEVIKESSGTLK